MLNELKLSDLRPRKARPSAHRRGGSATPKRNYGGSEEVAQGQVVKQQNGNKLLPCGHANKAENIWRVLQPQALAMVTQLLAKAGIANPPMLGLVLFQCMRCGKVVNLAVSAAPMEQRRIVTPRPI